MERDGRGGDGKGGWDVKNVEMEKCSWDITATPG